MNQSPVPSDKQTADKRQNVPAFSDGFVRNIYACTMRSRDAVTVEVPTGKYLSDVAPQLPARSLLYANTGIGKTTFVLNSLDGPVLFVTSTTLHVEQIAAALRAAGKPCDVFYHAERSAHPHSQLIVTTYESFQKIKRKLDASRFHLVTDEAHNAAASGSAFYRGHALDAVLDAVNDGWKSVTLLTGTPVPLSHPNLTGFVEVHVKSHVRTQPAQRVVWKQTVTGDDGTLREFGRKRDALLKLATPDKTHLIFLNNKRDELDAVRAGLVANGFALDDVHVLNSDTKHDATGRAIIESERVPDGCRVVICTSVALEAINIRSHFDCVHIYDKLHPLLAQQLVNRLRGAAAGIAYWYNASTGAGYKASVREFQRHWLDQARIDADRLNAIPLINLDDNSAAAVMARQMRKRYAPALSALVREVTTPDGCKRYDVSYTAVDNAVFDSIAEYTQRNSAAYKRMLEAYGWHWLEDIQPAKQKIERPAGARRMQPRTRRRLELFAQRGRQWTVENTETLPAARRLLARIRRDVLHNPEFFIEACAAVSMNQSERGARRLALFAKRGRKWTVKNTKTLPAARQLLYIVDRTMRSNDAMFAAVVESWLHGNDIERAHQTLRNDIERAHNARRNLAAELTAERLTKHGERVEVVRQHGAAIAQNTIYTNSADSAQIRVASDVLNVLDELTRHAPESADNEQAFDDACNIVLEAGDSRRAVNSARRQIQIQRHRHACTFALAVYGEFQPGDALTPEAIHKRMRTVFDGNEVMRLYAEDRYKYPFAESPESRLTQKKAVEVLRDFFTVKRRQIQQNGTRSWHYEILDDNPLNGKCTIIPVNVHTSSAPDTENNGQKCTTIAVNSINSWNCGALLPDDDSALALIDCAPAALHGEHDVQAQRVQTPVQDSAENDDVLDYFLDLVRR